MTKKANEIYDILVKEFPNARCELNYHNTFELLCAVSLSAQTTDERVNIVTKELFTKYPDPISLSKADIKDIENIISSVGLYHNKAINLINAAKDIVFKFDCKIPNKKEDLLKLSGVGNKTANVILAEGFNIPAFAVDTHVSRVSKRLALAKNTDDIKTIENKLCKAFAKNKWIKTHHLFIFFGRYLCKAVKPNCKECPLIKHCKYKEKTI